MKREGKKITWLTAYDYHTAKFEERAGVDMILMGDSLGGCVYGYPPDWFFFFWAAAGHYSR